MESEQKVPLIEEKGLSEKKKHNSREMICTLWMILSMLSFILCVVVLTCCVFLQSRIEGLEAHVIEKVEGGLPKRYTIPNKRAVIPKNQQQRGSCWIFSTVGYLESSYRGYGVDNGLLGEDEYVQFSEQACLLRQRAPLTARRQADLRLLPAAQGNPDLQLRGHGYQPDE